MRMNRNGELRPDATGEALVILRIARSRRRAGRATSPSTTATGSGAPPAQPTSNQRSVDERSTRRSTRGRTVRASSATSPRPRTD